METRSLQLDKASPEAAADEVTLPLNKALLMQPFDSGHAPTALLVATHSSQKPLRHRRFWDSASLHGTSRSKLSG
jgi:hypothetical protein